MSVTTESLGTPTPAAPQQAAEPRRIGGGLLDPKMLWKSTPDAFKKLDPRVQIKNPVMFVVEVGSVLTLYTAIKSPSVFNWTIVVWLWLTVVFANMAEAVAEGRGKAQAETLRRTKRETVARRLVNWQPGQAEPAEEAVPGTQLTLGDRLSQVGEHHGQPQPDHDGPVEDRRLGDRGVGGQRGAHLDHEHDRVAQLDPRVQLLKGVRGGLEQHPRVEQAAADLAGDGGRSGAARAIRALAGRRFGGGYGHVSAALLRTGPERAPGSTSGRPARG